ncbi:MAG: cellulase family glycosylhydrolase [Defluviitaleaceae bacterium]|nr:cellulase family glycosylhydrolase [Defluviitaleaceae bacterium]
MNKKLGKVIILAITLILGAMPINVAGSMNSAISAQEFVDSIGPGWNLGNTFDAVSGSGGFSWIAGGSYDTASVVQLETAWLGGEANAVTQEFIQAVYDAGFRAIRIPVSWHKVAPSPEYNIRADWIARVRQVVGWAYQLDMHIILNTHHENEVILLDDDNIDHGLHILTRFWEQIAPEFEAFGQRLIFAGLNEPRGRLPHQNEWGGGIPETRNNLNRLNQAFVSTVRASGGNNTYRFLMVPTHAASGADNAFNGFTIPEDTAHDRIILAVHTYAPFQWAHDGHGEYPGPAIIRSDVANIARHAARLGVPVILSEWGSVNNGQPTNPSQRAQHAYDYTSIARSHGMATFWWDNGAAGADGDHTFALFNRATGEAIHPAIIDAIIRGTGHPPEQATTQTQPAPEYPQAPIDRGPIILFEPGANLPTPAATSFLLHMDSYNIINQATGAIAQTMDVLPMIIEGNTLLPLHFVAELLGATTAWNAQTREVALTTAAQNLTFAIGEIAPGMSIPAQIVNDRTMVPLRFIAEFFGAQVSWNDEDRNIEMVVG